MQIANELRKNLFRFEKGGVRKTFPNLNTSKSFYSLYMRF